MHGVHTLSDVVVQAIRRWPAEHALAEHGVHAVAPLDKEKLEPSMQGVHTLSDVVVQLACWYVPAGHATAEQGVHAVDPLVDENVNPGLHAYCFLSPGHDDPILQTVQVPVSSVVVRDGLKY